MYANIFQTSTEDGVAIAIDRATHEERRELNSPEESVVRTICYNSFNDTIVIVYNSRVSNDGLRIAILACDLVREGNVTSIAKGFKLQQLIIPYPGFVEFEESNGRIVTSTAEDELFRFWDMETYEEIFTIPNVEFNEIRISRGTVAFFRQPANGMLSVKLCKIFDGQRLAECTIGLHPTNDLRFLELCGCYLLLKQESACVRVYDLISQQDHKILGTKSFSPTAITFFNEQDSCHIKPSKGANCFLAVHNSSMEVCCCVDGNLTSLVKISAQPLRSPVDCIQILQDQELLLVYMSNPATQQSYNNNYRKISSSSDMLLRQNNSFESNLQGYHSKIRQPNQMRLKHPALILNDNADVYRNIPCAETEKVLMEDDVMFKEEEIIEAPHIKKEPYHSLKHQTGIGVIDLTSGEHLNFIELNCDDSLNVLLYDPLNQEILAGGSKGLHRITTSFQKLDEENNQEKISFLNKTELKWKPEIYDSRKSKSMSLNGYNEDSFLASEKYHSVSCLSTTATAAMMCFPIQKRDENQKRFYNRIKTVKTSTSRRSINNISTRGRMEQHVGGESDYHHHCCLIKRYRSKYHKHFSSLLAWKSEICKKHRKKKQRYGSSGWP